MGQVELTQSTEGADRDQVLASDQRRWRSPAGKHLNRRDLCAFDATTAELNDLLIEGEAVRRQLLEISLVAQRSSGDCLQVAQIANALVPMTDQVRDAPPHPSFFVGETGIGVENRRRPVDEDDRGPGPPLAKQIAVVVAGGGEDQRRSGTRRGWR